MIDVDPRIKAAFQSDSIIKSYNLVFPEVVNTETGEVEKKEKIFKNVNMVSGSVSLSEPMCSEEQLRYGQCEAATFECQLEYDTESLTGRIFNVFLILGDDGEEQLSFKVGRYLVDTEEIDNDRYSKTITAYDIMYVLKTLDVTTWYYQLEFPITVKALRDSLFEYVNQEQVLIKHGEALTLCNDNIELSNSSLDGETEILFDTIITGLCEWNACFGHISREGKFDYMKLTPTDNEQTIPSKDLFPSNKTFPKSIRGKNYQVKPELIKSDITWQNYYCKRPDHIQVRKKNGRDTYEYDIPDRDTKTNIYVIESNWMTDAMDTVNLAIAVANFANAIKDVTYVPCTANVKMDLSLEVGDAITLYGTDGTLIPTYILNRTATGDCSAFDEIEVTGYEEWVNDSPSMDGAIGEMLDSINDLSDRVDALESGEGNEFQIISTDKLPEAPKKNVLYLIQGRITIY